MSRTSAGLTQPISLRTASLAGLILGLSTLIRPTNVLSILVFALALLIREGTRGLRAAVVLCASSTLGITLLLGHNALLFGSPFSFGYPTSAEGGKQLNRFDTPILTGLYGFLFSPGKSVFIFAPPVILALAGLRRLWRRDRALATLAVIFPAVELLFYAKYSQWEGGYCVGPRYLVPATVFLCLALGPVLADAWQKSKVRDRKSSRWFAPLGGLVQAVSLATSFMEDQVPRGRYYDAHWDYRLSYSLIGPIKLFWKYVNDPRPARLGLGWDRWFVFLNKRGVSRATLAILMAAMLAGLAISLVRAVEGRFIRKLNTAPAGPCSRKAHRTGNAYFWGLFAGPYHARNAYRDVRDGFNDDAKEGVEKNGSQR